MQLIGAKLHARSRRRRIATEFKKAMVRIGLDVPRTGYIRTLEEALEIVEEVGCPAIIRPAYTLGGTGGALLQPTTSSTSRSSGGSSLSPFTRS